MPSSYQQISEMRIWRETVAQANHMARLERSARAYNAWKNRPMKQIEATAGELKLGDVIVDRDGFELKVVASASVGQLSIALRVEYVDVAFMLSRPLPSERIVKKSAKVTKVVDDSV